jgi:ParB/RepB/Spo0J family partition protein
LPPDILRKGYDPDQDETFPALMESIRQTGGNIDPLFCEATGDLMDEGGEKRPILLVRAGVRRYYALTRLGMAEALIRALPPDAEPKRVTLVSLITNEMREPLSVLDRADVVAMLIDDYGLKQHVIAQYAGISQPTVSRLNMLASQPPIIKTMVSNESLNLVEVEKLNKRFKDDPVLRGLVARYYVYLGGKEGDSSIDEIAYQVDPPPGISPAGHLSLQGEEIIFTPRLPAPKQKPSEADLSLPLTPPKKPVPYWQRGKPLFAVPTRILQNHHPVQITGPLSAPKVTRESLHIIQFLEQSKRERAFDVTALEEAMCSDQEAIREALERQRAQSASEAEDEEDSEITD